MISLIHGDNLEAIEQARRVGAIALVDLAYLDPPFFTGQRFETSDGRFAFEDRWPSREAYLDALGDRIAAVYHVLAPHGSFVVHVDPNVSHYVKVLCDRMFGEHTFASEIIWRYRRWPSKQANFQAMHDVLLRYRKDPRVAGRWNQLYEPLAPSTVATWGTKRQRAVFVEGHRTKSSTSEEESAGVPLSDVWDIGVIAPVSKERTGYPTQKPLALLERLILALTNPGDLVLDPYCGSGTTLEAADRLGRSAIGIDASPVAIEVARRRLGMEAA